MSDFLATCRFLFGVAMVAGGVVLAAPLAGTLARCLETPSDPVAASTPPAVDPAGAAPALVVADQPAAAGSTALPESPPDHELLPRTDFVPPPNPTHLPPVNEALSSGTPPFARTYRSALDVPPPPLLDPEQSPPPVGWTLAPAPPVGSDPKAPAPSATHRIADGDDLEGIARRYYGHSAAAAAILAANRDRIVDPAILPIGVELRLPPAGALALAAGPGDRGGRAIEPRPAGSAAARSEPPAQTALWLGPPGQGASPPAQAGRPAEIVVAPGETLTAIAVRWFQDPAAARRIWDLNRDRLRSPELVVPGMHLRLP